MEDVKLRLTLAENLKREMAVRGISQSELGRRMGVPSTWICEIIAAKRAITLDSLERIAATINVTAGSLLLAPPDGIPFAPHSSPEIFSGRS